MTSTSHTYGSNCRLAPISQTPKENGMPPIDSRFFYSTLLPIDELLSSQRYNSSTDNNALRHQLRPFGCGDNNTLEKAWMTLASDDCYNIHNAVRSGQYRPGSSNTPHGQRRRSLMQRLAKKHIEQHANPRKNREADIEADELPVCCNTLSSDAAEMLGETFCALVRKAEPDLANEAVVREVCHLMEVWGTDSESVAAKDSAKRETVQDLTPKQSERRLPGILGASAEGRESRPGRLQAATPVADDACQGQYFTSTATANAYGSAHPPASGVGMSGKRVVGTESQVLCTAPNCSTATAHRCQKSINKYSDGDPAGYYDVPPRSQPVHAPKQTEEPYVLDVVVGVSRLHKVSLPTLLMKPIYWSPVNDVAVVMRATWFYRDTLMPVAPLVANQLEAGYQELQPWTDTWRDELSCAVGVGPLGEEKISHCLWPQDSKYFDAKRPKPEPLVPAELFCSAHCSRGDAAAQGFINSATEGWSSNKERTNRAFANYHVIYKDEKLAFLLKPSLRPSAYYGRKPASSIVKGFTVGIPVVRGFDSQAWDRIHRDRTVSHLGQDPVPAIRRNAHAERTDENHPCNACNAEKENGQLTDLILVAHGIGQKIAERVESFHFTHAINGFRCAVNNEMRDPTIQHLLRQDQNGVMILPLNWRMGLSFEDGGLAHSPSREDQAGETFGLKDIEPKTIPAIRSMISDVMFDIPFYMSHHKSKMIAALVSEANRVYRLWCRNNKGFADRGRVHLIAHSLGSVMAIDILSRQPTKAPTMDMGRIDSETQFFEFNTTNLFLLGSPVGFFLLLERGSLIPRRGLQKPDADSRDVMDKNVVSDAGRFGCLAVDNIYNILAKEDPIAYLLNGAVDPVYASTLKTAYLPSTTTSIFKSVGDAMRQIVPGLSLPVDPLVGAPERPSTVRLPSQLELEVHDFTREEIAEKRAFLLNDNGQIDWFLRSGSGPLEIQYLNMLSAHTSYWINQDLIRMLCLEIGRRPGRNHSIPVMRAVKVTKRFSLDK